MDIRILPRDEMEKAISLWQYCFQDPEPFTRWYFEKRAGEVLVTGNESLAAMAVTVPVNFSLRGEPCAGAMVSGVATAPAHRGRGVMREFMALCHRHLYERGAALAALYPFDYAFYEKFGWAQGCDILRVRTPLSRLPSGRIIGKFAVYDDPPSHEDAFAQIYTQCFAKYSGVLRDAASFTQRLAEHALDGGFAALYSREGIHEGYILYRFEGKTFIVEEFAALTHQARADILTFVAGHASTADEVSWKAPPDDMTWRILPDARGVATLEPYTMLRIIDIPRALNGLPARNGEIVLNIIDDHAPWNSGLWCIEGRNGRLSARKTTEASSATLSIGELTQWVWGYRSAKALAGFGRAIPPDAAAEMDRLLPECPGFMYEMY